MVVYGRMLEKFNGFSRNDRSSKDGEVYTVYSKWV